MPTRRHLINFVYSPPCAAFEAGLLFGHAGRTGRDCLAGVERPYHRLCVVCGAPIGLGRGDNANRWCRSCSASPPPCFTQARAITQYRVDEEERASVPSMIRQRRYGRDRSHALAGCIDDLLPNVDYEDACARVPLRADARRANPPTLGRVP